jgi:hypothetical protein
MLRLHPAMVGKSTESAKVAKRWPIDFAFRLCQLWGTGCVRRNGVNINVSVDCTPDEARRFLGLPDVTKVNEVYVDALTNAMQGVGSFDQLQEMAKSVAPMGQFGLKLFQQMMESGVAMSGMGGSSPKKD